MENTNVVEKAQDAIRLSAYESSSTAFTKLFSPEIKELVVDRNELNLILEGAQKGGIKIGKRLAYLNVALGSAVVVLAASTVALWAFNRFQKKNDR